MTSFIARTFSVISHQPETVAAVLAAARPLMNSSIVPVTLSDDDVWDRLCTIRHHPPKHVLENLLKLFSAFSDTMQFTEKLKFDFTDQSIGFRPDTILLLELVEIIRDLVENKKYFARTVQSITDFPSIGSIKLCAGKLSNLRSMGVPPSSGLKDSDLELICSKFNRLTQLDLNHQNPHSRSGTSSHIMNKGFQEISRLRFIEHLNLSHARALNDLSFLKDLTRLQSLNLDYCRGLTEKSFGEEGTLILSSLREISLIGTQINSVVALGRVQKFAPLLTSLSCSTVELGAEEVIGKMEYLRQLKMIACMALNGAPLFEIISPKLASLESLHISDIVNLDTCLEILSANGSSLKKLRFDNCFRFSDVGFCALATLEDLEVLELEDQYDTFTCDLSENNNSDSPFKSLKTLRLSNCKGVTNQEIQSTLRSLSLTSFELSLTGRSITDRGLRNAFKHSDTRYTLEKLNLDVLFGLKSLNCLTNLKVLKELSLWRSPILADDALVEVIPKLQHLEVLEVSGNKLTASGIRRATENLRWLKSLVVDEETEAELKHHSRLFFLVARREGMLREHNVENRYRGLYYYTCSDDESWSDSDDDEEEQEEEEEGDESLYRECCRHVSVD